jgi:hypothetical protein
MLHGTLLTESLRLGAVLAVPDFVVTQVWRQDVGASARHGQPSIWTFLRFQAPDECAETLAAALADVLLPHVWYADFEVADEHVVVFAGQAFRYGKGDAPARAKVVDYARAAGIPEHQLDWGE